MKLMELFKSGAQAPENRTLEQMIEEIGARGKCYLMGNLGGDKLWICYFETDSMGVKLEIKGDRTAAPFETVFSCYNKMYAMKILP